MKRHPASRSIRLRIICSASGIASCPKTILARGAADLAYKRIEPHLSEYMGEADKNTALFGECKWTNEKVDVGVLDLLIERSKLFHYKNVHYYLFAKSGFTKCCEDKAKGLGNVTLIEYSDMI